MLQLHIHSPSEHTVRQHGDEVTIPPRPWHTSSQGWSSSWGVHLSGLHDTAISRCHCGATSICPRGAFIVLFSRNNHRTKKAKPLLPLADWWRGARRGHSHGAREGRHGVGIAGGRGHVRRQRLWHQPRGENNDRYSLPFPVLLRSRTIRWPRRYLNSAVTHALSSDGWQRTAKGGGRTAFVISRPPAHI